MSKYYDVLGVSKTATDVEIKRAYGNLAKKYHPDRNKDDKNAHSKFQKINEAYQVLKDKKKRQAYDNFGEQGVDPNRSANHSSGFHGFSNVQGGNFEDLFGDIFGDIMGGRRNRQNKATDKTGSDLQYSLKISLEDAYIGKTQTIIFDTLVSCKTCKGKGCASVNDIETCTYCNGKGIVNTRKGFFMFESTCNQCSGSGQKIKNPCKPCSGNGRSKGTIQLEIDIPVGIISGARIKYAHKGEAGMNGAKSGDLSVLVTVIPHKIFKRDKTDLFCTIPILATTAMIGGEVKVPVISGKNLIVKIPKGIQQGEEIRVKNHGMSQIHSSTNGDLYLRIEIKIPKNITSEQKELVQKLNESIAKNNHGIWSKIQNWWQS